VAGQPRGRTGRIPHPTDGERDLGIGHDPFLVCTSQDQSGSFSGTLDADGVGSTLEVVVE
jgi:hypothetical protein